MSEEKKNNSFETQNPWIKRLGLFILIVGLTVNYWKENTQLFTTLLIIIILLAVVWGIIRIFSNEIKNLFK